MSCDHIFTFWSDQKLFVSWHCCCCVFWNTCKVFTINRWTEHIIWIQFIQMRDLLLTNEYREVFLTEVVSWKHAVSSINCMWMPMNDFLYHQWSHCSTIKKETTQDMFSLYVRTVNEINENIYKCKNGPGLKILTNNSSKYSPIFPLSFSRVDGESRNKIHNMSITSIWIDLQSCVFDLFPGILNCDCLSSIQHCAASEPPKCDIRFCGPLPPPRVYSTPQYSTDMDSRVRKDSHSSGNFLLECDSPVWQ